MSTKVMHKYFGLADFLDEQVFLEDQHAQGWKFVRFQGLTKYTFERCEQQECVYQLGYKEDDKDKEEYIQMFVDCGWEYLMKYQTWYYFRKPKSGVSSQDNEIFSDKDSKIDMVKKVIWRNLLTCSLIIFPFYLVLKNVLDSYNKDVVYIIIMCFYVLVMCLLLSINVHNVIKLNKLINDIKYPIDEDDK